MTSVSEWRAADSYEISTNPERLDIGYVHAFLETSYWSPGIPREVVEQAIANSLPFGLYSPSGSQVGFARVISDRATYAYLADLFVDPAHRRRGLGKFLVTCTLAHPQLQGLRRWALATADAHGLYRQFGFTPAQRPLVHMFIERPAAELWPRDQG
jgi:GNAT superfamily N-acetyltransferase